MAAPASRWADALHAAALLAVAPQALGGAALRCGAGPVRDRWLAALRSLLPAHTPWRSMPAHIGDERLLGGLDLAATLRGGRPVAQRGLLAEADGGLLVLPMAERLAPATCARLAAVMDRGEVQVARDGLSLCVPSRFGVVALDEGFDADEQLPAALADRLGFHLDLDDVSWREAEACVPPPTDAAAVTAARARFGAVQVGDDTMEALCHAALALGIGSARAPWLALQAARAAAALAGRAQPTQDDVELAARLVLAPRATCVPAAGEDTTPSSPEAMEDGASEPPPSQSTSQDEPPPPSDDADDAKDDVPAIEVSIDMVVAAAQAAIGAGLLARLQAAESRSGSSRAPGRSGATSRSALRGRRAGAERGDARRGARLNLIETLRAAAPWQRLRRIAEAAPQRIAVRPEDFRVTRFKQRRRTTTVFAIDASGSSALHRLAEAKGAVELLLADCYVRRDQVAVLAFRGAEAQLLLPVTRSLVRAKRSLAGLPGGGGPGRRLPARRQRAPPRRHAARRAAHRWPSQHRPGRHA
jgi:magnesium chelatase subunit D